MALQLPNQHDFQFSSVSVGDIIYRRDANYWANLHVGTSGQVLTAHGAGLAPSWEDAGGGGDLSTVPLLAPDSLTRNTYQPTADANVGLISKGHSATQSGELIQCQRSDGLSLLTVVDDNANTNYDAPVVIDSRGGAAANALFELRAFGLIDQATQDAGWTVFSDASLNVYSRTSDTHALALLYALSPSLTNATAAGRTSRLTVLLADHGGNRTPLTLEADGTAARIGFLGAAAVVRQLLATGAGHTVDDVITILQTFGLCKQS